MVPNKIDADTGSEHLEVYLAITIAVTLQDEFAFCIFLKILFSSNLCLRWQITKSICLQCIRNFTEWLFRMDSVRSNGLADS